MLSHENLHPSLPPSPLLDTISSLHLLSEKVAPQENPAFAIASSEKGLRLISANVAPEPPAQKAMRSDPRMKLLSRLSQSGYLNGEETRRRQTRDLKDYPDIAALAHVAKTKENFYEIMGSPQVSCAGEPKELAKELQELPPMQLSPSGAAVSPVSTSAGPDSSADEQPSPELLPRSYEHLDILELNAEGLWSRSSTLPAPILAPGSPTPGSPTPSRHSPISSPIGSDKKLSPTMQHSEPRCVDPDRADFLWKLAGQGSPQLKPLDSPEMETDGSTKTGVYLLSSPKVGPSGAPFEGLPFQGIFKPLDEEDFERRGIEIGMGAVREEAAFVIDRASGGQAYVPTTARASIEERGVRKKGSIQQFVEGSIGPVEDFGMPRELQAAMAMVGLDNAQAVACFDIRTFNTDRHPGNLLLAGPPPHKIVSIDHGCVLPAWWALESSRFDAWLDWPHVKAPPSPATLSLVTQVGDTLPLVIQELEKLGLPLQAIWTLEICTSLLQKCILTHGLTLRSVALLMTRLLPDAPCWLERTVADACIAAGATAKFKPEGKYGDLSLHIDQKIANLFLSEGGAFDNKNLSNFRDAFFIFLDGAFSHTDVIRAAQAAEDAARNPWD